MMYRVAIGLTTAFIATGARAECAMTNDGKTVCRSALERAAVVKHQKHTDANGNTIIGGRPAGCPHRYCGCGLRKYLGIDDRRLDLAWNWAKLFPRVGGPRAGLAAVRRGHVMYIEAAAGHGQWLVRDYNSGGGLSRLHVRDVRGYVFVDPSSQTKLSRLGEIQHDHHSIQ